jgi:hypothetical protein
MSLFLRLHAIAAARGDGLHPQIRALLERRTAEVFFSDATLIPDETAPSLMESERSSVPRASGT